MKVHLISSARKKAWDNESNFSKKNSWQNSHAFGFANISFSNAADIETKIIDERIQRINFLPTTRYYR